jgi:hypothetical protein
MDVAPEREHQTVFVVLVLLTPRFFFSGYGRALTYSRASTGFACA